MFPSTSESLLNNPVAAFTVKTTSSSVFPKSATATGASFTASTVISKVLVSVNNPSETVYVIWGTAPLKLDTGVKT